MAWEISRKRSLLFFFKFSSKGGKALFYCLFEILFMAKIKIITQPFNIIPMLFGINTSLLNKNGVRADKIGWYLNHAMLS